MDCIEGDLELCVSLTFKDVYYDCHNCHLYNYEKAYYAFWF